MRKNYIKCGDCLELMEELPSNSIDIIFTSPFYATNVKTGKYGTLKNIKVKEGLYNYARYDVFVDNMSEQEYCEFTTNLFKSFDRILCKNGCICYNLSYGQYGVDSLIKTLYSVISETDFTIADIIVWKKKSALPNINSPNKLTRICEYIFVLCRKSEFYTFYSNKKVVSHRSTGQNNYSSIFNFVEAKNNDGSCPLNKATFSSELVEKILKIYAPIHKGEDCIILDPFSGTGTTGVACKMLGISYIGFELSYEQCIWSVERIKNTSVSFSKGSKKPYNGSDDWE